MSNHLTCAALGLVVILVPIVVVAKSMEEAHKTVGKLATTVVPQIERLGGLGVSLLVILVLLTACWLVGLLVAHTGLGRRWLEWEKTKLLRRTPMLEDRVHKRLGGGEEQPLPSRPALVQIASTWQPAIILAEQAGGFCAVFVPELPGALNGRLHCVPTADTIRLDLTLEAFRKKLLSQGHGAEDWLQALARARVTAT